MKTATIYALAALCAIIMATAAAHGPPRGGDAERPSLPVSWQNVMTECKDQAQALCGPPEGRTGPDRRLAAPSRGGRGSSRSGRGRSEQQGPHPGRVALCVSDHESEFTGSCATAISGVSEEEMSSMLEQAQRGLTPAAQFKRACEADVMQSCTDSSDVLACLQDNIASLHQECATELQRVEEMRASRHGHRGDGSHTGHHGKHSGMGEDEESDMGEDEESDMGEDEESDMGEDEESDMGEDEESGSGGELEGKQLPLQWSNSQPQVPASLSPEAFNSIDGYEQQQSGDQQRRGGMGAISIAVIGVAAVAAVALVAGLVVLIKRRRAASRRVQVPAFAPMDSSDSIEVSMGEPVAASASSEDVPIAAKV